MLNVRKIVPLLRIVGSVSAIVVRADLFLNRPECVDSAWAVHIPVENVLGEVLLWHGWGWSVLGMWHHLALTA